MKISINLLPPETLQEETKKKTFYKVQYFGAGLILFLVFLTSLTLALQMLQNKNIVTVEAKLKESEDKVADLKNTQVSLFILKNRLSTISKYIGVSSKQASLYMLVDKLIPASVSVSSITVDKTGGVYIIAGTAEKEDLDEFLENLINKEKNENKIQQVEADSLTRGKDGIYRIGLKIKPV